VLTQKTLVSDDDVSNLCCLYSQLCVEKLECTEEDYEEELECIEKVGNFIHLLAALSVRANIL
jgi:hypothetical protein